MQGKVTCRKDQYSNCVYDIFQDVPDSWPLITRPGKNIEASQVSCYFDMSYKHEDFKSSFVLLTSLSSCSTCDAESWPGNFNISWMCTCEQQSN